MYLHYYRQSTPPPNFQNRKQNFGRRADKSITIVWYRGSTPLQTHLCAYSIAVKRECTNLRCSVIHKEYNGEWKPTRCLQCYTCTDLFLPGLLACCAAWDVHSLCTCVVVERMTVLLFVDCSLFPLFPSLSLHLVASISLFLSLPPSLPRCSPSSLYLSLYPSLSLSISLSLYLSPASLPLPLSPFYRLPMPVTRLKYCVKG